MQANKQRNRPTMVATTIPTIGLVEYVRDLAKKHGVRYVKTANDELADVITELADDIVVTDDTENLIVALKRANVIDVQDMVIMLGNYLAEKNNV